MSGLHIGIADGMSGLHIGIADGMSGIHIGDADGSGPLPDRSFLTVSCNSGVGCL